MSHNISINFYQNRPEIKLFLPKKYKIFQRRGSAPTPYASGGWGIRLQTPATPPIADFWLRACMKKNLLQVTTGLHLYYLLALNMPETFGDVLIHKRCLLLLLLLSSLPAFP